MAYRLTVILLLSPKPGVQVWAVDRYPEPFSDPWRAREEALHRIGAHEGAVGYRIRNVRTGKQWSFERAIAARRKP